MKRERKIILRTETFERIMFRQNSKVTDCLHLPPGVYQIVISRKEPDKCEVIVFESEIQGSIEIKEIAEKFRSKRK